MIIEKTRTYTLDFNKYLSNDYKELLIASKKITGSNELSTDLLHYAIEEVSYKHNLQSILDSGGMRFYLVRIMMVQWRSQTGPFYKAFIKRGGQVELDKVEHLIEKENEGLDIKRVNLIVESLPWYDKELWKLYVEGGYNYTGLAKVTGIPRTSIGLTINRVKKHIKKHI
jgi:DNA-directed RNA polymerase specialized sigma24 family protein